MKFAIYNCKKNAKQWDFQYFSYRNDKIGYLKDPMNMFVITFYDLQFYAKIKSFGLSFRKLC
jgi:hypothetical protein